MELIDTHCHIQSAGASGGEKMTSESWAKTDLTASGIIASASAASVTKLICVGCDLNDSKLAIDFVASQPNCWCSIGIHPHEAASHQSETVKSQFANLFEDCPQTEKKIVAIGECGLDYFYNHSPREAQIEILKFQIEVALKNDLPLIFHVREAFDDFWSIFENYQGIRGVLHSFTDSQANLEKALAAGLFIGVNGIATFTKDASQLAMYKSIPLENLLLETDAPFLTPVPHRGTINEPKHIRVIAEFLADLRHEPLEELAEQTSANARQLFGI